MLTGSSSAAVLSENFAAASCARPAGSAAASAAGRLGVVSRLDEHKITGRSCRRLGLLSRRLLSHCRNWLRFRRRFRLRFHNSRTERRLLLAGAGAFAATVFGALASPPRRAASTASAPASRPPTDSIHSGRRARDRPPRAWSEASGHPCRCARPSLRRCPP